jgi:hypothetical protein
MNNFIIKFAIMLLMDFILFSQHSFGYEQSVILKWDQNEEPNVVGYKLFYGNSSRNYNIALDVGNQTEYIVKNLSPGKAYFFAIKAYNNCGNESDFSNEISITIDTSISMDSSIIGSGLENHKDSNKKITIPVANVGAEKVDDSIATKTMTHTKSRFKNTIDVYNENLVGDDKTQNAGPVADAGTDQEVMTGEMVKLDGTKSYDDVGDALSFEWRQTAGTTVLLSDPSGSQPEFCAYTADIYTFELTVHTDSTTSNPDYVIIVVHPLNHAPIAIAGVDLTAQVGESVYLDGLASHDIDGDKLNYTWRQISGIPVKLENENSSICSFTALSIGVYEFQLIVSDGTLSNSDNVVVTVEEPSIELQHPLNLSFVLCSDKTIFKWIGPCCTSYKLLLSNRAYRNFIVVGETDSESFELNSPISDIFNMNKLIIIPVFWKVEGKIGGQDDVWIESDTGMYLSVPNYKLTKNPPNK